MLRDLSMMIGQNILRTFPVRRSLLALGDKFGHAVIVVFLSISTSIIFQILHAIKQRHFLVDRVQLVHQ